MLIASGKKDAREENQITIYDFQKSLLWFGSLNIVFVTVFFTLTAVDMLFPDAQGEIIFFKYRNSLFKFTLLLTVIALAFNVYWGIKAVSAYQIADQNSAEEEVTTAYACGIYALALPALWMVGTFVVILAYSNYTTK